MGTTELRLSDKQEISIAHSTAWLNVWEGSVRSGKTIASLLRWLMYVATAPSGGQLVVVGKTYDTVARNVFGPLQDPSIVGPEVAKLVSYTRGSSVAWILGKQIEVITANDAKAEARLRGLTGAGAYVDEMTLVPKEFFKRLIDRMSVPGALIFGTTNPDNPGHWLRKEWLLRADELGIRTWHFTLDDNPALSAEYVARMKKAFVGLWYRRYILGHWVQSEGAIYECFDAKKHVVSTLPRIDRWLCDAIDYGTVNPYADVLIGLGADRKLYVVSEYRYDSRRERKQMTDSEYSKARRTWLAKVPQPGTNMIGVAPEFTVVDPSASSYIEQLHRDRVLGVTQADNSVLDGIRTVSSLLSTDDLFIHESAQGLIDEMPGYSWDDEAAEHGEDKPIKQDDHSVDALRYGIRTTESLWRPYLPTRLEVAA
ncbi:PBSX family phage terminase large subunit [Streptomyces caniscabiei]|uniref:PBSX family phage terminase large subunit n=1 Tax=Streptomyces caniscabiei TaxID=2746961 RepID=UPI0018730C52|nr:PBSX family phage terminase large subunit [Streptomyces caniscabiei]MBE4783922.1 PBSX family phage terminase large subunit [Streptomyces caniscabiei]MBE4791579.1 PBSX family phage terminase large subunit [Streptomyces caniscabiei]MDX3009184.1 PBSX family phage terminase large subunit [Streptomyces caniscabiei]